LPVPAETAEAARASRGRREIVRAPALPEAVGSYSQAVGTGGFVFVSGQAGIDPATGRALVVNTTVSLARGDFAELDELFAGFFPLDPPARMIVQVPLPRGLLISIGCTAVVAEDA